jgi:tight adherence protein C
MMEQIFNYLSSLTSSPEQQGVVVTVAVAFLIFVAAISIMFFVVGVSNPIQKRLRKLRSHPHSQQEKEKESQERLARLKESMNKATPYFMPRSHEEISKIRAKLQQAGFRSQNALFLFFSIKTLLAIVFPVFVFIFSPLFPTFETNKVIYLSVILMGIGVFLPNAVLERLIAHRQEKIQRGFADFLDLLVVCVEAGLGLDLAIRRVTVELKASHPILADELSVVSGEINAGVDRLAALKNFSDRTGLDDIKGFVALLTQSIRFGTRVANTLRIYSVDFRDKRVQRAEEKAAKVGTKLIFPMVFCFFPVFYVVAIGPVILKVFEVFGR